MLHVIRDATGECKRSTDCFSKPPDEAVGDSLIYRAAGIWIESNSSASRDQLGKLPSCSQRHEGRADAMSSALWERQEKEALNASPIQNNVLLSLGKGGGR